MDETSAGLRDRLIEAAARAMHAAIGPHAVSYPEDWRPEATAAVDATMRLLADEIERLRDDESVHHERCSLTEAAALVRSAGVVL